VRSKGRITHWNDDKGYGFIQPDSGAEKVFVHIREFGPHAGRPGLDEKVSFELSTDKQGRPCAVRVARAGAKPPGKARNDNFSGQVLIAMIFMLVVGMSVFVAGMPIQVLYFYLAVSLITYSAYARDKSAARNDGWRTSENTLHTLALIGGWPGAMIAQQTLRHKSSKRSFRAMFWVTVLLNCGVYVWLFTPAGARVLRFLIDTAGRMASDFGIG
jgi:uncharacterized membrane protein YsdA (DUF1294 family)/cold shock CspA family protein